MVKFRDGPAAGVVLMLRRAPLFLRVTRDPRKRKDPWDALELLRDEPQAHEGLHAYRRLGKPIDVHIDFTRKSSGWFQAADYVACDPQPDEATMRSTEAWRAWCLARQAELKAAAAAGGRT